MLTCNLFHGKKVLNFLDILDWIQFSVCKFVLVWFVLKLWLVWIWTWKLKLYFCLDWFGLGLSPHRTQNFHPTLIVCWWNCDHCFFQCIYIFYSTLFALLLSSQHRSWLLVVSMSLVSQLCALRMLYSTRLQRKWPWKFYSMLIWLTANLLLLRL